MGAEELVLRLLAFYLGAKKFQHTVSEFLDEFMILATEGKIEVNVGMFRQVLRVFALIRQAFPDGEAFRFSRGGFSTNLFDIVAVGALANIETLDEDTFKARYEALRQSEQIKEVVGAGSNSKKKLLGRISLGTQWFGQ